MWFLGFLTLTAGTAAAGGAGQTDADQVNSPMLTSSRIHPSHHTHHHSKNHHHHSGGAVGTSGNIHHHEAPVHLVQAGQAAPAVSAFKYFPEGGVICDRRGGKPSILWNAMTVKNAVKGDEILYLQSAILTRVGLVQDANADASTIYSNSACSVKLPVYTVINP